MLEEETEEKEEEEEEATGVVVCGRVKSCQPTGSTGFFRTLRGDADVAVTLGKNVGVG